MISATSSSLPRQHDLDALRAAAMLWGIAIHATAAYFTVPWVVQDSSKSPALGWLFFAIHGCRLPLFFFLSGYFTTLLWHRRGLRALLKQRMLRVVAPLALGVVTLLPLTNAVIQGTARPLTQSVAAHPPPPAVVHPAPEPSNSVERLMNTPVFQHLWFLWFLVWLVGGFGFVVVVVGRLPRSAVPSWAVTFPVVLLGVVPLTMLPQAQMWTHGLRAGFGPDTSAGLVPIPHVLAYSALFFGVGALSFGRAPRRVPGWPIALGLAFVVVLPLGLELSGVGWGTTGENWPARLKRLATITLQVVYPWLAIYGLMGLFHRVFSRENDVVRYLADSAYWLYLAHLPLVIALQAGLRDWPLPAVVKFGLVCGVALPILLLSYHLLVRPTALGWLLNGRRSGQPGPRGK